MSVNNDDLIRAVFIATDEAKAKALAILEGRNNPDTTSVPLLLTMGEAASLLNTSRATLWRILKRGRLQKVELYPGAFRLRRADVVSLANGKAVARG